MLVVDPDRRAPGWRFHLCSRVRTIRLVSRNEALDFDQWTDFARGFQTRHRQLLAWNKPSMAGRKRVVRIPDRFSKLGL